jgi:hypothetical protein
MEIIPQDVWSNVFSFLPVNQLPTIACTGKEWNSMIFSTETQCCNQLWRMYCIQQLHGQDEEKIIELLDYTKFNTEDNIELKSYIELYKSRSISFDTSTVNTKVTNLVFSNGNRTVHNMRESSSEKWDAIRLNKKLVAGRKYTLKFRIDKYIQGGNVWVICIGINNLKMNYRRETDTEFGTYGCYQSDGLTLIAYDGTMYDGSSNGIPSELYNAEFLSKKPLLAEGDIVTMIVDMTNASAEHDNIIKEYEGIRRTVSMGTDIDQVIGKGTSVEYIINGKPLMKHPYHGIAGQEFYATVALINHQKVSVLN